MPITQDRMIALIDCSITLTDRLESLKNLAEYQKTVLRNNDNNETMAANMLDELHRQVAQMAALPMKVIYRITHEQAHFEASKRKNEIAKEATRRWRRNKARLEKPNLDFEDYLTGADSGADYNGPITKAIALSVDLEDIIPLIIEGFEDNPNGDKTLDSLQINRFITEAIDETDENKLFQITLKLLKAGAIQPRYKKNQGPEGVFIRGPKIGGTPNAATAYGQDLID